MSLISALGRQGQVGFCESKASLLYIKSEGQLGLYNETLSQKQETKDRKADTQKAGAGRAALSDEEASTCRKLSMLII